MRLVTIEFTSKKTDCLSNQKQEEQDSIDVFQEYLSKRGMGLGAETAGTRSAQDPAPCATSSQALRLGPGLSPSTPLHGLLVVTECARSGGFYRKGTDWSS